MLWIKPKSPRPLQCLWRWLLTGAIAPVWMLPATHTMAQNIVFDGTLGPTGTPPIRPVLGNPGLRSYRIFQTMGKTVGPNLFHSFGQFHLNSHERAFFQSTSAIRNILVRVTGNSPSTIDGQIATNTLARVNVFFLNPNGITFGRNARIDGISGSFVATTLDAIVFPTGRFSATNPSDSSSLLTVVGDPTGFVASQRRPGDIQINRRNVQTSSTVLGTQGILAPPGQTLIFLGGNVSLNQAAMTINEPNELGRRIELGGITAAGFVGLTTHNNGFNLVFPDTALKADIILNRSQIEFNTSGGSRITINARNLRLTDSSIFMLNRAGGSITINAQNFTASNSNVALQVQGGSNLESSQGGTVQLRVADTLTVTNNSIISSEVREGGTATGGDVDIHTRRLLVQNSQVRADTFGIGNAGNLTIQASELVDLSGDYSQGSEQGPGGVFAQVNSTYTSTGVGQGGNLTVITPLLRVQEGSKVQAATFGQGNAGNIFIQSREVEIIDTPEIGNRFPTGINAGATLTLIPDIDARGGLQGNGGNLTIATDRLRVRGSDITVENFGLGSAGNLNITARDLVQLSDRARITAETRSGRGGNINLTTARFLLLSHNSQISSTAGTAQAGGDGGNILINAPQGFVIGLPLQNSDITANAFTGNGGRVTINAQGIFGLMPRSQADLERRLSDPPLDPQRLPTNDITASSQFGLSGTVILNTLNVDPNRGLVALPVNLADPSQQLAQACKPGNKPAAGRFVATGRGGIPLSPDEPLEPHTNLSQWLPLPEAEDLRASQDTVPSQMAPSHPNHPEPIVEAQGWIVQADGTVELVAIIPTHDRQEFPHTLCSPSSPK